MDAENAKNQKNPATLNDSELGQVAGGRDWIKDKTSGKYYRWDHGDNHENEKFLCPNCGRPVHYGTGWRYYCDPCNESWFIEYKLVPNVKSGLWREISKWEYDYLENLGD